MAIVYRLSPFFIWFICTA